MYSHVDNRHKDMPDKLKKIYIKIHVLFPEKLIEMCINTLSHKKKILNPIPHRFQSFLCNPADKPTNKPGQFSKNITLNAVLAVEMFPIKSEWVSTFTKLFFSFK